VKVGGESQFGCVTGLVQMLLTTVSTVQFHCHSCWWTWMLRVQMLSRTLSRIHHAGFSAAVSQTSTKQPASTMQPTLALYTLWSVLMMKELSLAFPVSVCFLAS